MVIAEVLVNEGVSTQHQARAYLLAIPQTNVGDVALVKGTRAHLTKQDVIITFQKGMQVI
ncbi:hypothetical protein D3C76_1056040 [compost metagenome]